jgi:chemotaxis protein MotB
MIKRLRSLQVDVIPQWQTIYCSLMLLLFVFFVMLVAYSAVDKNRLQQVRHLTPTTTDASAQAGNMDQAMNAMKQLTQDIGLKENLSVIKTDDGFKAVIPNPVLFASGDASLSDSFLSVLDGIVTIAQRNQLAIQIEGHTDNLPIETSRFPSNWELSTQRAVNVLRYLQKRGGIPPERLVAVGFGQYQPIASNDTPEGRQINRRIEVLFRSGT